MEYRYGVKCKSLLSEVQSCVGVAALGDVLSLAQFPEIEWFSDSGATGGTFLGVYMRMIYRVYRYWCYYIIAHAQRRKWYYRYVLEMCFSKVLAQNSNNILQYNMLSKVRALSAAAASHRDIIYTGANGFWRLMSAGCVGRWWGYDDCAAMIDINEKRFPPRWTSLLFVFNRKKLHAARTTVYIIINILCSNCRIYRRNTRVKPYRRTLRSERRAKKAIVWRHIII